MNQEIQNYLDSLNDDELRANAKTASFDLQAAAENDRDSEWHGSCFAATVLYAQEMTKRGINLLS